VQKTSRRVERPSSSEVQEERTSRETQRVVVYIADVTYGRDEKVAVMQRCSADL